MASRGRPKQVDHKHVLPDPNGFKIKDIYKCQHCRYEWMVWFSPLNREKHFWMEVVH